MLVEFRLVSGFFFPADTRVWSSSVFVGFASGKLALRVVFLSHSVSPCQCYSNIYNVEADKGSLEVHFLRDLIAAHLKNITVVRYAECFVRLLMRSLRMRIHQSTSFISESLKGLKIHLVWVERGVV